VIGRKLLHYEIVARLGAGGRGEVWRAVDPRLQRDVAIKILPSAGGDAALLRERFVREARAASALAHPNIAPNPTWSGCAPTPSTTSSLPATTSRKIGSAFPATPR
jgi:serine/threonine protein kinase